MSNRLGNQKYKEVLNHRQYGIVSLFKLSVVKSNVRQTSEVRSLIAAHDVVLLRGGGGGRCMSNNVL